MYDAGKVIIEESEGISSYINSKKSSSRIAFGSINNSRKSFAASGVKPSGKSLDYSDDILDIFDNSQEGLRNKQ